MNIIEIMNKRKSVRKYSQESVSFEVFDWINSAASDIERLYPEIDMKVHIVENGKKMQEIMPGIIGAYGKVRAPHYMVVSSIDREGYLENVGYTLEQIVLGLSSMGVGTCWIGGSVSRELFNNLVNMPHGHVPAIIIAFGYAVSEEELYRKSPDDAKRKKVAEFVTGEMDETMSKIMESVKIAPSAVNLQPWKYFIEGDRIRLYTVKANVIFGNHLETMRKIDAGICLSHFKLAAQHYGKDVRIERENNPELKKHVYITTAYIK